MIPSRISGEDFARLEQNIASAEASFKNKKDRERLLANFEFHTMIAEMTENPIIILMHKLIHDLLYEFFENVQPSVPMTQGTLEDHKKIAEYLREGNFEAASLICLEHIEKVSRQIAEKSKKQSFLGRSTSPR